MQERIQDFKLGGYFVWKITILRQTIIFFPIAEGGAKIVEVFRVKNHDFTTKKSYFFQFQGGGGARRVRPPPPDPPLAWVRARLCKLQKRVHSTRKRKW